MERAGASSPACTHAVDLDVGQWLSLSDLGLISHGTPYRMWHDLWHARGHRADLAPCIDPEPYLSPASGSGIASVAARFAWSGASGAEAREGCRRRLGSRR